ncbi:polyprenyl synthetase family protein [Granulicella paludicola]|uniref:polyprenyl synthetase family protein n=1 Tax=Granulicella paludicola TaxID=474951 RepID=UPI0021E0CB6F|nr:polyprenyl synthetase family protein [Granulicella paludicola]
MSSISIASAAEVFDLLKDDLAAIEREFTGQSASPVAVVTEIANYLIAGGGKRIRPLLLILAAKALESKSDARIRLGAVVEMLHTATLVHDDIIDEASTRRGRPSSNTTWGNAKCVLAGDWLYMQAFQTALEERNFRILDLLISLTQEMVEGELLQMEKLGHLINEEEYFDLIYRKTACLFQVSMKLGAVIANPSSNGHDKEENSPFEQTLGEYGRNLGLAFQIVDDVLDLTATDDVLGKPAASDLREGKATLAVIHALERGTGADREAIRTVLADRSFARVAHQDILEILQRHGSLAYAMDTACAYAEAARQSIAELPENEYKRALLWVPTFVTTRDR